MKAERIFYGPYMMALTEKRRRFVWALMANPNGHAADWAREAGYSDVAEGCKVRACECLQDPKVQAAVREVSRGTLDAIGPALAVAGMIRIATDPNHKDNARAIEMIANRTGFAEKQQIEVIHRDLTGDALTERVRLLEAKYGLGPTKVIEHERARGTSGEVQPAGTSLAADDDAHGDDVSGE